MSLASDSAVVGEPFRRDSRNVDPLMLRILNEMIVLNTLEETVLYHPFTPDHDLDFRLVFTN